jgi:6,7-dimethyl-8-ribityllumazine synthase
MPVTLLAHKAYRGMKLLRSSSAFSLSRNGEMPKYKLQVVIQAASNIEIPYTVQEVASADQIDVAVTLCASIRDKFC